MPADGPGMLAWRTFLTAHATIIRALEAELEAEQSLALSDFDVLAQLHAAGGTLRMRDLADRVLLSRSGLTRRVDRLESDGFVERAACETDRRGSYAHLTDAGRERLGRALPVHSAASPTTSSRRSTPTSWPRSAPRSRRSSLPTAVLDERSGIRRPDRVRPRPDR